MTFTLLERYHVFAIVKQNGKNCVSRCVRNVTPESSTTPMRNRKIKEVLDFKHRSTAVRWASRRDDTTRTSSFSSAMERVSTIIPNHRSKSESAANSSTASKPPSQMSTPQAAEVGASWLG